MEIKRKMGGALKLRKMVLGHCRGYTCPAVEKLHTIGVDVKKVNVCNEFSSGNLRGGLLTMSYCNWIRYAAVGITISLCSGPMAYAQGTSESTRQSREHYSQKPNSPDDSQFFADEVERLTRAIEKTAENAYTSEEAQRSKDDLKAQQDMAKWAFGVVLLSAVGLILSTIGIWFVAANLRETRRAISKADANAKDQSRAYIHADNAFFIWGNENGSEPSAWVVVRNVGETPAKWFEVKGTVFTLDLNEDQTVANCPEFDEIAFPTQSWSRWNAIGGQGELSCGVGTLEEFSDIAALYENRQKISIHVAGVVRYETYYGEVFESQFWFFKRFIPRAIFERTGDRDGKIVKAEKHIKLVRISKTLETYKKVS